MVTRARRTLMTVWSMFVTAVVLGASQVALAQVGTPAVGNEGCVDGNCGFMQRVWAGGGILGVALLVGLIVLAGWGASFMMRGFKKDDDESHRFQV